MMVVTPSSWDRKTVPEFAEHGRVESVTVTF